MYKYYMNLETGEVLMPDEMLAQYAEEYDGNDPTNALPISEYYETVMLETSYAEWWR